MPAGRVLTTKPIEENRGDHVYPPHVYPWMWALSTAASLLALGSIVYGVLSFGKPANEIKFVLLGSWALLPPLWFLIEGFVVYPRLGLPNTFDKFKYGQDVASKFWVAVGAVLAGLYLKG